MSALTAALANANIDGAVEPTPVIASEPSADSSLSSSSIYESPQSSCSTLPELDSSRSSISSFASVYTPPSLSLLVPNDQQAKQHGNRNAHLAVLLPKQLWKVRSFDCTLPGHLDPLLTCLTARCIGKSLRPLLLQHHLLFDRETAPLSQMRWCILQQMFQLYASSARHQQSRLCPSTQGRAYH